MTREEFETIAHAEAIVYYPRVTYAMQVFAESVKPGLNKEQVRDFYLPPKFRGWGKFFDAGTIGGRLWKEIKGYMETYLLEEIETELEGVRSRSFDSIGSGCSVKYTTDQHVLGLIQEKESLLRWLEYAEAARQVIEDNRMLRGPQQDVEAELKKIEEEIKKNPPAYLRNYDESKNNSYYY